MRSSWAMGLDGLCATSGDDMMAFGVRLEKKRIIKIVKDCEKNTGK